MNDDSELDSALATLPRIDVSPRALNRIRTLALAELDRATRPRPIGVIRRLYRRVEPALVTAVAASYLWWAVGVVLP